LVEQRAAQQRLAGANLARHLDEALALRQRHAQQIEAGLVRRQLDHEAGIRSQREGLLAQAEECLVHVARYLVDRKDSELLRNSSSQTWSLTTCGRIRITSSVCSSDLRCCWNRAPAKGSFDSQGTLASSLLLRFSSRPPFTTTWPLRARTMESDWRVVDSASGRLKTLSALPSWMLLFWSCTRLTVGRTCRVIWSLSSICGVTSSEIPEKNGVRVMSRSGAVVPPASEVVVVDTSVTKNSSVPTLITAFWLFKVEIRGLESTRTSPWVSRSCTTPSKLPKSKVAPK